MKISRKKYLLRNTIIFAISTFATKLISFLLIPLYTNILNPSEYGKVDLLFTICNFLYPLFTLNISEAIYRFSMDKRHDFEKIKSIGLICFIFSALISVITIPILYLIPNYKNYAMLYYFYLVTFSASQILLATLKGEEKLKLYGISNIINSISIAFFNVIYLLVLKKNIDGYFYSYILSNIIVILFIIIKTKDGFNFHNKKIDKELFGNMIKYSLFLIPTSFMWWIINSSDRIMVTYFVGEYANGIYSISYKIPSLLTTMASIFNQAWMFSAITEKDSNDVEKYTNDIFTKFFIIMNIFGLLILLVIKPLFKIYVSEEYYIAWKYVPFLVIGFIFMTSSTFISTSYNVYKDSKGFLFSGLIGAIINIILNIILIPILEVYGASIATCISYIIVFLYRKSDTKKYVKINFNLKHILLLIIVIISAISLYVDNIIGIIIQLLCLIITIIKYKDVLIELVVSWLKNKRVNEK